MFPFLDLLRRNRNYRYTWIGQIVSEVGDHFNTIAVFSLGLRHSHSGVVVSGVLLSRALAVISAGPVAGVILDRMDRRRMMVISDVVRAVVALAFIACLHYPDNWILYLLSFLLMFASPFFTSGRAAILPTIASPEELHTANSLTQTTQWTTLTIGTMLGGTSVMQFGYDWAFVFNALSFVFSAICISQLRTRQGFRPPAHALTEQHVLQPWRDYKEGLRYMRGTPLLLGLALINVGWASGGGTAQVLFSVFGELVFGRGAGGIGIIWGCAGIGLILGGALAHRIGPRLSFSAYKKTVAICYLIHGLSYVTFSQMQRFSLALVFIALSRAAVGVTSVLNMTLLLRHVDNAYRGRVFSTMESMTWAMMMLSMTVAGVALDHYSPRMIGAWAGLFSSTTAIFWTWANWAGKLPEPTRAGVEPAEVEVHGEPNV